MVFSESLFPWATKRASKIGFSVSTSLIATTKDPVIMLAFLGTSSSSIISQVTLRTRFSFSSSRAFSPSGVRIRASVWYRNPVINTLGGGVLSWDYCSSSLTRIFESFEQCVDFLFIIHYSFTIRGFCDLIIINQIRGWMLHWNSISESRRSSQPKRSWKKQIQLMDKRGICSAWSFTVSFLSGMNSRISNVIWLIFSLDSDFRLGILGHRALRRS